MRAFSRRGFFALLASAVGATGLWLFRGERRSAIVSELDSVLEPDASTTMIGQQYLRRVPDEADQVRLRELILSGFGRDPLFEGNVRILIREAVKQDFAEDRMVRLGQWMLSQTEARLCALTVLAHRDRPQ